jgi:hypothetical protein
MICCLMMNNDYFDQVEGLMMCESKMISKNNDEVDVGCGNAFGGEGAEEAGTSH